MVMDQIHPLDKPAVRAAITQGLNVSQQAITNWKIRGVPVDRCADIERITKGSVKRWDLRVDWFKHWPELIGIEGAPEVPAEQGA